LAHKLPQCVGGKIGIGRYQCWSNSLDWLKSKPWKQRQSGVTKEGESAPSKSGLSVDAVPHQLNVIIGIFLVEGINALIRHDAQSRC